MNRTRVIAVAIAVIALFTSPIAEASQSVSLADWPQMPATSTSASNIYYGLQIQDSFDLHNGTLSIAGGVQPSCTSMQDPACTSLANAGGNWWIVRMLPACALAEPGEDCIDGLSVTSICRGVRRLDAQWIPTSSLELCRISSPHHTNAWQVRAALH